MAPPTTPQSPATTHTAFLHIMLPSRAASHKGRSCKPQAHTLHLVRLHPSAHGPFPPTYHGQTTLWGLSDPVHIGGSLGETPLDMQRASPHNEVCKQHGPLTRNLTAGEACGQVYQPAGSCQRHVCSSPPRARMCDRVSGVGWRASLDGVSLGTAPAPAPGTRLGGGARAGSRVRADGGARAPPITRHDPRVTRLFPVPETITLPLYLCDRDFRLRRSGL